MVFFFSVCLTDFSFLFSFLEFLTRDMFNLEFQILLLVQFL
jgi:hypothetical protein